MKAGLGRVDILRLRACFALRSSHFAQDDKAAYLGKIAVHVSEMYLKK